MLLLIFSKLLILTLSDLLRDGANDFLSHLCGGIHGPGDIFDAPVADILWEVSAGEAEGNIETSFFVRVKRSNFGGTCLIDVLKIFV